MSDQTTLRTETLPSGLIVIKIMGDLDSLGTHMIEADFNRALAERSRRALVDLHNVGFISSAGLALLLVRGKMLRQSGGNLVLAGANPRIQEVLAMAGINELFDTYATTEEALEALGAA